MEPLDPIDAHPALEALREAVRAADLHDEQAELRREALAGAGPGPRPGALHQLESPLHALLCFEEGREVGGTDGRHLLVDVIGYGEAGRQLEVVLPPGTTAEARQQGALHLHVADARVCHRPGGATALRFTVLELESAGRMTVARLAIDPPGAAPG
jgi:hypothetical protein